MAMSGRKMKLYHGATLIAGGRTDTITINNEPADITSKSSDGWRTLLADPNMRSVDISAEALFVDEAMIELALSATVADLLDEFEVKIEGIGDIGGTFHLSGLSLGAPHNAEATQSITLASSGPVTFTAAP